jgi:3'-phosphoadenosine 5'-phosphosulfate (PAPS) 3'-phosphatase
MEILRKIGSFKELFKKLFKTPNNPENKNLLRLVDILESDQFKNSYLPLQNSHLPLKIFITDVIKVMLKARKMVNEQILNIKIYQKFEDGRFSEVTCLDKNLDNLFREFLGNYTEQENTISEENQQNSPKQKIFCYFVIDSMDGTKEAIKFFEEVKKLVEQFKNCINKSEFDCYNLNIDPQIIDGIKEFIKFEELRKKPKEQFKNCINKSEFDFYNLNIDPQIKQQHTLGNIAIMQQDKTLLGFVYCPGSDIFQFGGLGYGSFMIKDLSKQYLENNIDNLKAEQIFVINPLLNPLLNRKLTILSSDKKLQGLEEISKNYQVAQEKLGSSLKGMLIASSENDKENRIFIREKGIYFHDIAAIKAIVEGAGGVFFNRKGEKIKVNLENLKEVLTEGLYVGHESFIERYPIVVRKNHKQDSDGGIKIKLAEPLQKQDQQQKK